MSALSIKHSGNDYAEIRVQELFRFEREETCVPSSCLLMLSHKHGALAILDRLLMLSLRLHGDVAPHAFLVISAKAIRLLLGVQQVLYVIQLAPNRSRVRAMPYPNGIDFKSIA